jgi:methylenetetrahydrofolate--tRNA-(uracil-5-)-methyltransferase
MARGKNRRMKTDHNLRKVTVIGGGLAGSEASWQLASSGISVDLFEMRPLSMTPAHRTEQFAELVCSNSLGADSLRSPGGILKAEMRRLDSLIMNCADKASVPAGNALAVDREIFADLVTESIKNNPLITVRREKCDAIPEGPVIIATGPLTSPELAEEVRSLTGGDFLYFFDAVAPVVLLESVDMDKAYWGGRYGRGNDYLNCPMTQEEYAAFHEALVNAEVAPRHEFEKDLRYFEGCLPIEVIASRGVDTLRFGPLKPVGLPDPSTGEDPYAVVQLRQDNREGTLYNMVGFQTNLRWGAQEKVLRMIPALSEAEFARLGVMHRNIYVNAPVVLDEYLRLRNRPEVFLAGQITGVEGYMESAAMGLVAGRNMAALISGEQMIHWPRETAIGSLLNYLSDAETATFRPMNVNLGIFPRLEKKIRKRPERCQAVAEKALEALDQFLSRSENL